MCNAITHPAQREVKMIEGFYGKREWEYWVEFDKATILEGIKA